MTIILQETTKSNKYKRYYRVDKNNISIGRGYHNDIILDDAFISAEHIKIYQHDDTWVLDDLDSTNGVSINKSAVKKSKTIVSGDTIQLGQRQFQFLLPDHPVAPAAKFSAFESLINLMTCWPVLVFLILLTGVISLFETYLTMNTKVTWDKLLLPILLMMLVLLVWPIIYSLMAKIFKGEPRFFAQVSAAFLMIASYIVLSGAMTYLLFNIKTEVVYHFINDALDYVILFALLILSSLISYRQSIKKRLLINGSLVALLFVSVQFFDYTSRDDFSSRASYHVELKPKKFIVRDVTGVDEFLESIDHVFVLSDEQK